MSQSKIKRLSIPETVTKIEGYTFEVCRGLTGELHLPSTLTFIGRDAFLGCSGLTSVRFPSTLTKIDDGAFYGCSGLTGTLVIPASVKNISHNAFMGSTGLSKLVIEGAPSIDDEAFLKSNNEALPLDAVYSKSEEPKAISSRAFWHGESYGPKPKVLYVPRGTKAKYKALAGWNVFQKIEEMDVEAMPK